MAFLAPLAALATAGAGIAGAVTSIRAQRKASQAKPPPRPEDAKIDAKADVRRRKRISFLSGGQTNVTGGAGALAQSSSVNTKSLVGV